MKIFVGTIAYNTEFYIKASLKSLYDYVDKIYVIDGSAIGPSTDKTASAACSVGKKVEVISGTFKRGHTKHDREWGEQKQRQEYIDHMEKDKDNWCILHDADEVWDSENIKRLIEYAANASPETMLLSYQWVHFWRDPWHIITGGIWDKPRAIGMFRLMPGVTQTTYNTVGIQSPSVGWTWATSPTKVILKDVFFYHYGHVQPFERYEFKVKCFVEQGLYKGYAPDEWERYRKEVLIPWWNKGNFEGVSYFGDHPEVMHRLIRKMEKFWKKQK